MSWPLTSMAHGSWISTASQTDTEKFGFWAGVPQIISNCTSISTGKKLHGEWSLRYNLDPWDPGFQGGIPENLYGFLTKHVKHVIILVVGGGWIEVFKYLNKGNALNRSVVYFPKNCWMVQMMWMNMHHWQNYWQVAVRKLWIYEVFGHLRAFWWITCLVLKHPSTTWTILCNK